MHHPCRRQMPAPLRGPMSAVDAVQPHVRILYDTDEEFRSFVSSLSPDDSPSGRLCFDDARAALKVKDRAKETDDTFVCNLTLGKTSTAVKYNMRRVGLARPQRIEQAHQNLLKQLRSRTGEAGSRPAPKPPFGSPAKPPGYDPRDIVITSRNFR